MHLCVGVMKSNGRFTSRVESLSSLKTEIILSI